MTSTYFLLQNTHLPRTDTRYEKYSNHLLLTSSELPVTQPHLQMHSIEKNFTSVHFLSTFAETAEKLHQITFTWFGIKKFSQH